MRERKYIKFRVDMYEDTKFKIIDRMPKRDLIHYVWNRFVILAGKVNREGDLYMSKNIPYTVETLAIEFNRDIKDIETALDVLIELEMMELTGDKVYRVKNFAKHQNIKIKEKIEVNGKVNEVNEVNDAENNMIENEVQEDALENKVNKGEDNQIKGKLIKFDVMPLLEYAMADSDGLDKSDCKKKAKKTNSSQHNNLPVILDMKENQKTNRKNKKVNKKKISNEITETDEDNLAENIESIENIEEEKKDVYVWTTGEDVSLKEGERVVSEWGF